jgi:hypothetical protein
MNMIDKKEQEVEKFYQSQRSQSMIEPNGMMGLATANNLANK